MPDDSAHHRLGRAFGTIGAVLHRLTDAVDGLAVHCPVFTSCGFSGGVAFGLLAACGPSRAARETVVSPERRFRLFREGATAGPYPCRLPDADRLRGEASALGRLRERTREQILAIVAELHSGRVLASGQYRELPLTLPCGCRAVFAFWVEDPGGCPAA